MSHTRSQLLQRWLMPRKFGSEDCLHNPIAHCVQSHVPISCYGSTSSAVPVLLLEHVRMYSMLCTLYYVHTVNNLSSLIKVVTIICPENLSLPPCAKGLHTRLTQSAWQGMSYVNRIPSPFLHITAYIYVYTYVEAQSTYFVVLIYSILG